MGITTKKDSHMKMINEFSLSRQIYESFTIKIENLIRNILSESSIKIHSINSRTKGIKEFSEKIVRIGKNYSSFREVTDLSGVRIICLLSDQVDKIAEIIKKNFTIIDNLSVDKRQINDPDRFGYLSLHYVIKLSEERVKLDEYNKYEGLLCEIQIRSILQHTWAEIEHDLGYKSAIAIPKDIKRRFYRLAGLLELADDEFNRLQKDIDKYTSLVETEIKLSPQKLFIDKISLSKFIITSPTIKELDDEIAKIMGGAEIEENPLISEFDLKSIKLFNIKTINDLDQLLKENFKKIIKFAKIWIKDHRFKTINRGISVFYLFYVLSINTKDINKISNHIHIYPFADKSKLINRLFSIKL